MKKLTNIAKPNPEEENDFTNSQIAIEIIEKVIEPLLLKGLNGKRYYDTEDKIVEIIKLNR
jgi:hypothetical protein